MPTGPPSGRPTLAQYRPRCRISSTTRSPMNTGATESHCAKAKLQPECWVEKGSAMTGMLKRKVVVISGVGPGLGTTLAHRCSRDGADLVLAARTLERLEEVAKAITDTGHKALAVRTDITDDNEVNSLVEATMGAYGKVDVLIKTAFRVPSMK